MELDSIIKKKKQQTKQTKQNKETKRGRGNFLDFSPTVIGTDRFLARIHSADSSTWTAESDELDGNFGLRTRIQNGNVMANENLVLNQPQMEVHGDMVYRRYGERVEIWRHSAGRGRGRAIMRQKKKYLKKNQQKKTNLFPLSWSWVNAGVRVSSFFFKFSS